MNALHKPFQKCRGRIRTDFLKREGLVGSWDGVEHDGVTACKHKVVWCVLLHEIDTGVVASEDVAIVLLVQTLQILFCESKEDDARDHVPVHFFFFRGVETQFFNIVHV